MKENRLLSSLSGFGIVLVVLGHSTGVTEKMSLKISLADPVYAFFFHGVVGWIFTFHMPLFFAISGFLYCHFTLQNSDVDLWKLVRSKFNRLIVPYLTISTISYPVKVLLSRHALRPVDFNFYSYLKSMIFPWENTIVYFWFLPTLFFTFIIGSLVLQKRRSIYFDFCILTASICCWWLFPHHSMETALNFLNISGIFHNFIFFLLGFFISKYSIFMRIKKFHPLGIASALISLCLFAFFPQYKFCRLIMAVSGIILSVWICFLFSSRYLASLGDYSYQIYLFSWFPQVFVRIVFGQVYFSNIWLSVFLSFVLGLLIPVAVTKILNRTLNPGLQIFYGMKRSMV